MASAKTESISSAALISIFEEVCSQRVSIIGQGGARMREKGRRHDFCRNIKRSAKAMYTSGLGFFFFVLVANHARNGFARCLTM